jgi:hypothetical protein
MGTKYSGSEWLILRKKELSPIGRVVADILGQVFRGIYHMDRDALRADWSNKHYIELTINAYRTWSSYDDSKLTTLIVLCHDAGIRLEIQPAGPRYFRLLFHQRAREGDISTRMPTMEEHLALIREHYSIPEIVLEEPETITGTMNPTMKMEEKQYAESLVLDDTEFYKINPTNDHKLEEQG